MMMMMMIIWIISSVLLVLFIISLIINRNLYIQNAKYEELVEESSSQFFQILDDTRNKISDTHLYIKVLDHKEMFEKDDEVGVVFSELRHIIERLNEEMKVYAEETEDD